jgi:hypothetical protein
MRATYPADLVLYDMITVILSEEDYKLGWS